MILRLHNGCDYNVHENTLNWEKVNKGIAIVSAIAAARKLSPLLITLAHESNLSSDLCDKYFSKYLTLFSPLVLTIILCSGK